MPGTVKLGGSISVNGEALPPDKIRRISGFVHQEDVILSTMTVRGAWRLGFRGGAGRGGPRRAALISRTRGLSRQRSDQMHFFM